MEKGRKLYIRSLVNMAAEPIAYFWPMRTFITRNPLRGLEDKPFKDALKEGELLFGGRGYLRREDYRYLYSKGYMKDEFLREGIRKFLSSMELKLELPYEELLFTLFVDNIKEPALNDLYKGKVDEKILNALMEHFTEDPAQVCRDILLSIGLKHTLQDIIELLTGKNLSQTIDELTIKTAFDFLDEGQSTIDMPGRGAGFYKAWRELAKRNLRFFLWAGKSLKDMVEAFQEPEPAIEYVLTSFELPQALWEGYISLELARLKGIAGFIKWRSHNKFYYWQKVHPVDMVDYTAIRLLIAKAVIDAHKKGLPFEPTYRALEEFLNKERARAYLLYELGTKRCPPQLWDRMKDYLKKPHEKVEEYVRAKAEILALSYYLFLTNWTRKVGIDINSLTADHLLELMKVYEKFKEEEGYIYLRALEDTHIDKLVKLIRAPQEETQERPLAQAFFCIDVRSERFRRHLESLGRYQTYGIAGFFGVPVAMVNLQKGHEEFLCPVIVTPRNVVFEVPYNKRGVEKERVASHIFHSVKDHVLAPFVAVEMLGFAFGFDFLGKTFLPEKYLRFKDLAFKDYTKTSLIVNKLSDEEIQQIIQSYYSTLIRTVLRERFGMQTINDEMVNQVYEACLNGGNTLSENLKEVVELLREKYKVERGYVELFRERLKSVGFTKEEQAFLISTALKSIGLTKEFAPIVLVLGHESRSENNPYESALDCGACGGASGIYNARIFCIMANDHVVRQIMAQRYGLEIPPYTVFIPGVHNTTTDEVFLYDLEFLPAEYIPLIDKIIQDLQVAKDLTLQERAKTLDTKNTQDVYKKAYDWSEVRPEWGLSGNYAFIIGRRSITKLANLDGRVFLHSYDYRVDKKGFLLENILAGPAVVGQWINSEYYFSTVDNEVYGSGSKVYHNVVGRIGVMTGNYSDLRTGLPAQTVLKEGKPFHIPIRYTLIVEAPFELARNAINKIRKIRDLMQNGWINLLIFDPEKEIFYRYLEGVWVEYFKKEEVKA
ncbi:Protein of unknown function DUF2309 [Thermocrinis albus DSM 14484]|uniref:Probable inorganic carbon transporter subunit DabA n=1 Tax=Thermocrinis albus (strain DSM 14484 / JCM 11386 / HI 11/12) TaxID=638303 RepID=D3SP01_THEAH|nr:DUF2309 domain-containing protein [Thermocrinis albus]ADC88888.1 Protein of unknown function DUF2309 [Thermocrinis albus DSM 14484]